MATKRLGFAGLLYLATMIAPGPATSQASLFNGSAAQQAAWGWIWAGSFVESCGGKVAWNTASGKAVSQQQAFKLLRTDGHARRDVLPALRDRSALPFQQLDTWLRAAGFQPNADNISRITCDFAERIAGKSHPVGRFLKKP